MCRRFAAYRHIVNSSHTVHITTLSGGLYGLIVHILLQHTVVPIVVHQQVTHHNLASHAPNPSIRKGRVVAVQNHSNMKIHGGKHTEVQHVPQC